MCISSRLTPLRSLLILACLQLGGSLFGQVILADRTDHAVITDFIVIDDHEPYVYNLDSLTPGDTIHTMITIIPTGYPTIRLKANSILPDTIWTYPLQGLLEEVSIDLNKPKFEYHSLNGDSDMKFVNTMRSFGHFIPLGDSCRWLSLTLNRVNVSDVKNRDSVRYRICLAQLSDSIPHIKKDSLYSCKILHELDVVAKPKGWGRWVRHELDLSELPTSYLHSEGDLGIILFTSAPLEYDGGTTDNHMAAIGIVVSYMYGFRQNAFDREFTIDYTLRN